jgi:hypothetical protein
VTREAIGYLRALFSDDDAPRLALVEEAVADLEDPAMIRAALRTLTSDLLARL